MITQMIKEQLRDAHLCLDVADELIRELDGEIAREEFINACEIAIKVIRKAKELANRN
jgi:hypothetical protein